MRPAVLRGPAAACAAAGLLASLVVTAPPAHAAADVDRISGENRYETGALVSADGFRTATEVDVAYLATGEKFADALSAGAAAFANDGPVILTTRDRLDVHARDELRRLQPRRVVVVGGDVAIADTVLAAVRQDDQIGAETVERIGGETRYHTAANVVTDAFPDADTVFVATGEGFADALSGVPAATRYEGPLLLTAKDTLPAPTRDALASLAPRRVVILGGEVAISTEVEGALADYAQDVDRLAGPDRYATGVKVSQAAFVGARTVYVATGENFPDALAGGPVAGKEAGPLLLTQRDVLPSSVASELLRLNPRRVVILGGTAAVADSVRDEIRRVLSRGTALPSGQTPDLAFATVDNRADAPTRGYQVINVGTFDGSYETLTNPGAEYRDVDPVMSPDGRRLVFTRFADAGQDADPYLIDVAVGAASTRKLFDLDSRFGDTGGCMMDALTWSPDGDQLAFLCYRDQVGELRPSQAVVADLRGRTTVIPLPGSGETAATGLAYHPDGDRLAIAIADLASDAPPASASRVIEVDPARAAEGSTGVIATTPTDGGFPQVAADLHWSLDGSTIVGAWGNGFDTLRLLVIDPSDGSTTLRMTPGEHVVEGVTADGSRALVTTHGGTDTLRLVPTASGSATTIADGTVLEHGQIWTASLDRDRVVFDDLDGELTADHGNVWVSNLDASGRSRLFDVADVINGSPSLNPQRGAMAAEERAEES